MSSKNQYQESGIATESGFSYKPIKAKLTSNDKRDISSVLKKAGTHSAALNKSLAENIYFFKELNAQQNNLGKLSDQMKHLSDNILGAEHNTTKALDGITKGISSLNNITTTPLFSDALVDYSNIESERNKLEQFVSQQIRSLNQGVQRSNDPKVIESHLKNILQLKLSYSAKMNEIDRDELTTTFKLTTDWLGLCSDEIKKFVSENHDAFKTFSAAKDVSGLLGGIVPDSAYQLNDYDVQKESLDKNLELTLMAIEKRRQTTNESRSKLDAEELSAIKQHDAAVFKLGQDKLKFQLQLGQQSALKLSDISKKYLSNEHQITKSLSSLSKTFSVTQSILPSMYDGLKGYENKLLALENDFKTKQIEYQKKAEQYPEMAGLWEYSSRLNEKEYQKNVQNLNVESDAYKYTQMGDLFSGYQGIAADHLGSNNDLAKGLGIVSSGFGVANDLTLGFNQLDDISVRQEKIEAQHLLELESQKNLLDQKKISEEEYANNVIDINQNMYDQLDALQSDYSMTAISMFSSVAGGLAEVLKATAGEGSKAYRVMFLASKASAIAEAVMNTEVAATKAMAMGGLMGTVLSGTIRGLGYASIGIIAGQTLSGQAHDGIDYIPSEGTWLLDKGERVVDARTNADLKNFLQTNQNGGGQLSINVPVNVNGEAGNEGDAKQLAFLIKASIQDTITKEMRPGGLLNRRT